MVALGRVRNNSPVKWSGATIEVQYYNGAGKLVGARTEKDLHMVLLPGCEHAFQIAARAEVLASEYASQKVFVRDAGDARRWP